MPRAPRIEYEGAIYHVMARGNRREPIVFSDSDRESFVKTLSEKFRGQATFLNTRGKSSGCGEEMETVKKCRLTPKILAFENGEPFNLVIIPRTKTISRPLQDAIRQTGGKFFQFDRLTESFSSVVVEGNKVIRN